MFGHVENTRMRAYLEGLPGAMTDAEALMYSAECLEADIRADEAGMENAPPIDALNAREFAFEAAQRAAIDGNPDDIRKALQSMWEV